jgi:hypothetical protein
MASGGPDGERWFVEVGRGFLGILHGSQALKWLVPGWFLEASSRRLYLAAKPSQLGVEMDGLARPLHHPMVCSCSMRGQSFLPDAVLSHHTTVGGGTFLRGAKAPGLDI